MTDPRGSAGGSGVSLVVGASRGIGLALVEAQLADASVLRVIATRRPLSDRPLSDRTALGRLTERYGERLQCVELDVSDEASVAAFAAVLRAVDGGVDLAIHAAGLLHDGALWPEKALDDCKPGNLRRLFEVNSIGPLMVASALLQAQNRRRRFTFAVLSAMVGSIGDNRLGGWYGYRASKAALNQFIRTLAIECRVKHPLATILAIHPGTTDTGLSRPFQRNVRPGRLFSPATTAARILQVIASAEGTRSGCFLNWDGSELPW
jgi:NAD(P)-dependent dehydrogenase (short-subunit alcohol dehydrogenase family)